MSRDLTPVFAYGTLTDPGQVESLLDDWRFDADAVLEGLHRVEGQYPTLAPGGQTEGRLLVTPHLDVLDAYEGVDAGLYVRVGVPLGEADQTWLYVGDPSRLDAPDGWPGEGAFAERVRQHLATHPVRVRRTDNR
jgi:gamma-glutamylcyclotransferase (GGCT)/AIG2-like uncharacterized protein YtfP